MKVRAKFTCIEMTEGMGGRKGRNLYSYKFYPVTEGSPENEQFFAYTPSGQLQLSSINEGLFEVGEEYYLDFTLVAKPAPDQVFIGSAGDFKEAGS